MKTFRIRRGLDIPIPGQPRRDITPAVQPEHVALVGLDYPGIKPSLLVREGDAVKLGQPLFIDKRSPVLNFTSPASGTVTAIHRGDRRILESIVIRLSGNEAITFPRTSVNRIAGLSARRIRDILLKSGLWTAIRARPFSEIAIPGEPPRAVFITAMDTQPLAPPVSALLDGKENSLSAGITALARLTGGPLFLCKAPETNIQLPALPALSVHEFSGPHPAGNAGTHIHYLDPVHEKKHAWYIGLQDTVAIGQLLISGQIPVERIIALAGPGVQDPRLLKTRLGASLPDLLASQLRPGNQAVISGSVLSGRRIREATAFLGRYHQQITVLPERADREFLGWLKPGLDKYSVKKVFLSRFFKPKDIPFTTAVHGSPRALVPIGSYEAVFPLDILPGPLFRSLLSGDIEESIRLGCLELDEEDVALCSFVCPSKIDFGPVLRHMLARIRKEML